jgi:hypothetical protein
MIPVIPSFKGNLYLDFSSDGNLNHLVTINIVPTSAMATPVYSNKCGGEKNVSGLFRRWFVISHPPPTVTSKIPKLITRLEKRKNLSEDFSDKKFCDFSMVLI